MKACAIWGTPVKDKRKEGDKTYFDSARAGGEYCISGTASTVIDVWCKKTKINLTTWLVNQRRLGTCCPEITGTILEEVERYRPLSVHDRADNLLRYLFSKSDILGKVISFCLDTDYSCKDTAHNELLAWTSSGCQISEVLTLSEYCHEEKWINLEKKPVTTSSGSSCYELMLKSNGYARLAYLNGINPQSDQALEMAQGKN
ncbi:MAG: hypothetical protein HOI92_03025, partial [Alphaproteobacteria bacterium]|nr:hypothetical protein [Alphaproteobacteria bacterium]